MHFLSRYYIYLIIANHRNVYINTHTLCPAQTREHSFNSWRSAKSCFRFWMLVPLGCLQPPSSKFHVNFSHLHAVLAAQRLCFAPTFGAVWCGDVMVAYVLWRSFSTPPRAPRVHFIRRHTHSRHQKKTPFDNRIRIAKCGETAHCGTQSSCARGHKKQNQKRVRVWRTGHTNIHTHTHNACVRISGGRIYTQEECV